MRSSKKTYKVVGRAPAFGHKPGETFERALTPDQEKRMVGRGAIEPVSSGKAPTPQASGDGKQQTPGQTPAGKD